MLQGFRPFDQQMSTRGCKNKILSKKMSGLTKIFQTMGSDIGHSKKAIESCEKYGPKQDGIT